MIATEAVNISEGRRMSNHNLCQLIIRNICELRPVALRYHELHGILSSVPKVFIGGVETLNRETNSMALA